MGKVNFLKDKCSKHHNTNCQKILKDKDFGICDDDSYPHAYADTANPDKWLAPVNNEAEIPVIFIPVDKSLNILKDDGTTQSTCDSILQYENNIVFIELKDKTPPWISKAIDQLKNTIRIFDDNHGLNQFKKRRAFAANKKESDYAYNLQDVMDDFKRETHVRLIIEVTIKI